MIQSALRSLLAFTAGLVATAGVIGRFLFLPEIEEIKPKLDYLRTHPGEFDTFFFGSSRVYHHVIPALFDRTTAACGRPTRCYNAGIDGMWQPELTYYLEHFLSLHPRGVRWVFLEATPLRAAMDKDKVANIRGVYWHDLPRTWLELRADFATWTPLRHATWSRRWEQTSELTALLWPHVSLFCQQSLHLGRVTDGVSAALSGQGVRLHPSSPDGYDAALRPEEIQPADLAEYQRNLAKRQASPATVDYGEAVSQEAFHYLIARIERETGASVVLLGPPTLASHHFHPEPEGRWPSLDFWDLKKYPELYELSVRQDTDHLNQAGARLFTQLLAKRFCEEVPAWPHD